MREREKERGRMIPPHLQAGEKKKVQEETNKVEKVDTCT